MEVFENGGSASLCGRAKTEVFENDYVTGIGMSPVSATKTDVFLSVFGGQVWTVENAAKTLVWTKIFLSVFKKQKTEVFENALVWTGPKNDKDFFFEFRTRTALRSHQTNKKSIIYTLKI